MARIGIVTELPGETRVAASPTTVGRIGRLGYEVVVQAGAGERSSFPDAEYIAAGATIADRDTAWAADVVLKVAVPTADEIALLQPGATIVGLLSPALRPDLLAALRGGIKTVLIPEENAKDIAEVPDSVKNGLEIVPVSRMEQVLERALVRQPEAISWDEPLPAAKTGREAGREEDGAAFVAH